MTDTKKRKLTAHQKELAKYEKAKKAAAKHQERNRKLRERYVGDEDLQDELRESLVADLLRVYDHPCNPFKGFAASRKRYRELGRYPEILVIDYFGNHQEFLRAADLHDKRTTTKIMNKSARLHSQQLVARYAEEHVLRWHNKYDQGKRRGHIEVVFGSDFHSRYCDPFALRAFLEVCRTVQPEFICLGGDLVDFPQMSRHRKLPGHFTLSIGDEITWARENLFKALREACPGAQIDFIIGNHEARLITAISDSAPQLADLPNLSFANLFGLDDYEINLICRSNFLATTARARKNDVLENWKIYGDSLAASHGTSCAKNSVAVELERFKMSVVNGHTHRPAIQTSNSLGTGPIVGVNAGMMAHHSDGRDFVPHPSNWTTSFARFSILPQKRIVSPELVFCGGESIFFAGTRYDIKPAERRARKKLWEV